MDKKQQTEVPKQRQITLDMHIHTFYSIDSENKPEDIFSKAREAGINVLGVCDHDTVEGAKNMKKLSPSDITVLLGQEVRTEDGEVLVYGVNETLQKKIGLVETCKMAKEKNGFIIVPHPFDKMRDGIGNKLEDILNYIDVIEVFNAHCLFNKYNNKAKDFAEKHNIPMIAGSDSHSTAEIGAVKNIMTLYSNIEINEKNIFSAIKSGNITITETRNTGIKKHIRVGLVKLKKNLKKKF